MPTTTPHAAYTAREWGGGQARCQQGRADAALYRAVAVVCMLGAHTSHPAACVPRVFACSKAKLNFPDAINAAPLASPTAAPQPQPLLPAPARASDGQVGGILHVLVQPRTCGGGLGPRVQAPQAGRPDPRVARVARVATCSFAVQIVCVGPAPRLLPHLPPPQ